MLLWLAPCEQQWQLVELFAGKGNVSAHFHSLGKAVASLEKDYGGAGMDFTTPAGLASDPRLDRHLQCSLGSLCGLLCALVASSYVTCFDRFIR